MGTAAPGRFVTASYFPRVGYAPMSPTLTAPGDRRRFAAYARARDLAFELASPDERYDVVVLSERCDISAWAEYPHGKVVFDFVDSYLAVPRSNAKQWLRGTVWYLVGRHRYLRFDYWKTLQDMCRRADAVVCTTEEQKADIRRYRDNVHVILDIQDSTVRAVKASYRAGQPFNLVWEGLATNVPQLLQIRDVLREVHRRTPLILHVVTDPDQPRILGSFGRVRSLDIARRAFDESRLHEWQETTAAQIICGCDLAVIPIDLSDPFVTGKPENKLLLFWRMGMPVVTSATPAYLRTMRDAGLEDFACAHPAEWVSALRRMLTDETLRREAGERGRQLAMARYHARWSLERWDAVFESIGFVVGKSPIGTPVDA